MNVYIASHCRWAGLYCASVLESRGHRITSRWLWEPFHPTEQYDEKDRHRIAMEDFRDVSEADAVLLIAGPDRYSGGKFVEVGIAMGLGIPVTVLGRRENMLMWHPGIRVIDHPDAFGDA